MDFSLDFGSNLGDCIGFQSGNFSETGLGLFHFIANGYSVVRDGMMAQEMGRMDKWLK